MWDKEVEMSRHNAEIFVVSVAGISALLIIVTYYLGPLVATSMARLTEIAHLIELLFYAIMSG